MQSDVPPYVPTDALDPVATLPDTTELAALYDRSVDSAKGFATMVEKAEPSFRATAARFRALHDNHVGRLADLLAARGAMPGDGGSIMGTVNEVVVSFRAFFDDIDEDVMDQVRRGEDWVLTAFDSAIAEQPEIADTLRTMRADLSGLLSETRDLG